MNKILEIKDLDMSYGEFHVLYDINFDMYEGDVMVLCGPSGAGKSTLLRCINRLERPSKGTIKVFGKEISRVVEKIY